MTYYDDIFRVKKGEIWGFFCNFVNWSGNADQALPTPPRLTIITTE